MPYLLLQWWCRPVASSCLKVEIVITFAEGLWGQGTNALLLITAGCFILRRCKATADDRSLFSVLNPNWVLLPQLVWQQSFLNPVIKRDNELALIIGGYYRKVSAKDSNEVLFTKNKIVPLFLNFQMCSKETSKWDFKELVKLFLRSSSIQATSGSDDQRLQLSLTDFGQ